FASQGQRKLLQQPAKQTDTPDAAGSGGFRLPGGCLLPAADAEFREDLGDVVAGAVVADTQAVGDLAVGESLAQQVQDLPLPWRKDVRCPGPAAPSHDAMLGRQPSNYTTRLR